MFLAPVYINYACNMWIKFIYYGHEEIIRQSPCSNAFHALRGRFNAFGFTLGRREHQHSGKVVD